MSEPSPPPPHDAAAVDLHLETAGALVGRGRLTEALDELRQAERLSPDDAAVQYGLGGVQLHLCRYAEAVGSLQRAVTLDPELAEAHYHLGLALQCLGHRMPAGAALRRAIALDPSLADAHARLGDMLLDTPRHDEAIACFRRAAAAAPGTAAARINEAKALIAEGRRDAAEAVLRQLLGDSPGHATAHGILGDLHSSAGRFEAAVAAYRQAIALEPGTVTGYVGLVAAKKIDADDAGLLARMAELAGRPALTGAARMALQFSLGKAYDDLKDYERAMRHFDAANELRRGAEEPDLASATARVDRVIEQCTHAYFAGNVALGAADESPVLIVGMPRSGTTLVEQILSSHPAVGAGGELTFWDTHGPEWLQRDLAAPDHGSAMRLASMYRARLRALAPGAVRVIDKQPTNFEWIGLIRLVFPRARIIHCRRDPLDTCISIYCTPLAGGRSMKTGKADLVFYYRQYQRLMAHWRRVLPPTRFLEVDYEALVADREAETRRMIGFLGLEWDDACLHHEANPHAVQTVSMWQVRQPIYRSSVERWRRYETWLGALRELAPQTPE